MKVNIANIAFSLVLQATMYYGIPGIKLGACVLLSIVLMYPITYVNAVLIGENK